LQNIWNPNSSTGGRKSQRNRTLSTVMSVERRLYPRILVNWPATLHNVQGSIEGKTKDISADGVFIYLSEKPKFGVNFPILLRPSEEHSISLVGKKIWSRTFNINNRPVFGMGVKFMLISPEDRQFISTLVEEESGGAP
jgi:hypothetical protein